MKANIGKKPDRPSPIVVINYILLQLPSLVAFIVILVLFRKWLETPTHLIWGLFSFWVGKDIVLFPFLWRHYDPNQFPDRFQMVGRKGVALTQLNPDGYVQVQGERWQARIFNELGPIDQGEGIYVKAINGLKLTVIPCIKD
jgi:membrane protein implicated in regulation of membrane protease activity